MIDISEILAGLKLEATLPGITRRPVMPYKMETSLQVIEAIGRTRSERFVIDDCNRFVYENLVRWVHGDPAMVAIDPDNWKRTIPGDLKKGIFLGGRTGTGKSWAMEIMAIYTRIDHVLWQSGERWMPLEWENVRTSEIASQWANSGSYTRFSTKKVICFQDLASEPNEALYMGNRLNVMRAILEERGDDKTCITHITSNIPPAGTDMEAMYGQRVVSRLREMCNFFVLGGQDRRR